MQALTTLGGDRCPICEGAALRKIDLEDYGLFSCARCGAWSSDALFKGATSSFDPEHYFQNADADRDKWQALVDVLSAARTGVRSILDVGCGTGHFLAFAHATFPQAHIEGIELDAARAEQAGGRAPWARVHSGDAAKVIAGIDERFDLITLWDVFEHLTDPVALLAELARRLESDGVIYIQTIHEHSVVPALGRWAYRLTNGRVSYPARRTHEAHHLVFFSRRSLALAAERAGLRVRKMWFDRLARSRMDGSALVTSATALLLAAENAAGNGLFVNLLLERRS